MGDSRGVTQASAAPSPHPQSRSCSLRLGLSSVHLFVISQFQNCSCSISSFCFSTGLVLKKSEPVSFFPPVLVQEAATIVQSSRLSPPPLPPAQGAAGRRARSKQAPACPVEVRTSGPFFPIQFVYLRGARLDRLFSASA